MIALLAWKLAVESIKRLRKADYGIDVGRPYFDVVCEFMVFLAVCADRIAFREFAAEDRLAFTTALVKRLAEMIEENNYLLLGTAMPGECRQALLDLFNRRGDDYAAFDYTEDGPDFGFRRCFAAGLRDALPEKDQLWVVDQAMEIEAPDALRALEKAMHGLLHPPAGESRRRQDGSGK